MCCKNELVSHLYDETWHLLWSYLLAVIKHSEEEHGH